jgi:hypothetical protein
MHRHDGSTGARARSAQIRAAHDYEANRLEAMHTAGAEPGGSGREPRTGWLGAAIARLFVRQTSREVPAEFGAAEAAAGPR